MGHPCQYITVVSSPFLLFQLQRSELKRKWISSLSKQKNGICWEGRRGAYCCLLVVDWMPDIFIKSDPRSSNRNVGLGWIWGSLPCENSTVVDLLLQGCLWNNSIKMKQNTNLGWMNRSDEEGSSSRSRINRKLWQGVVHCSSLLPVKDIEYWQTSSSYATYL